MNPGWVTAGIAVAALIGQAAITWSVTARLERADELKSDRIRDLETDMAESKMDRQNLRRDVEELRRRVFNGGGGR